MYKSKKVLLSTFALFLILSMLSSSLVLVAADDLSKQDGNQGTADGNSGSSQGSATKTKKIAGNAVREKVQAGVRTMYQFKEQTRVTINSSNNMNVNINCDADAIGNKEFEVNVQANNDKELTMTMTCTEEQKELGLMNGSTVQVRNRVRHRYEEGFVAQIECQGNYSAQLKMKANEDNQGATWAYYDEASGEWIPVQTREQDGYIIGETNHFSTWTLLIPELDMTIILIVSGIVAVALIGVIIVFLKKRK